MELKRLVDDKESDKTKKKSLALRVTNVKSMESEDEDCQSKSDE